MAGRRPGGGGAGPPLRRRGVPPCRYCATGAYILCENFLTGELAPGAILGFTQGVGGGMAEMMAAHPSRAGAGAG